MGSIAYRTDESMLYFHRSKGHSTLNFWRLSMQKFDRFHVGDYLFFIDPKSIHPLTKERGIVGYGKAISFHKRNAHGMWEAFKEMNGFETKSQFLQRIEYYHKMNEVPEMLQSIMLSEVTYFSHPIYPSTVGISINKNLESFTYLEPEEVERILRRGSEFGVDIWAQAMNQSLTMEAIPQAIETVKLRAILETIDLNYTPRHHALLNRIPELTITHGIGYRYKSERLELHFPYHENLYMLIGVIEKIKYDLHDRIDWFIHSDKATRYTDQEKAWLIDRNITLL